MNRSLSQRTVRALAIGLLGLQLALPAIHALHEAEHHREHAVAHAATLAAAAQAGGDESHDAGPHESDCAVCQAATRTKHLGAQLGAHVQIAARAERMDLSDPIARRGVRHAGGTGSRAPPTFS